MWNKLHDIDPLSASQRLAILPIGIEQWPPDKAWQYWFDEYRHSIFMVVPDKGSTEAFGSAFLIHKGVVATCAHVVKSGAATIYIGGAEQLIELERIRLHADAEKGVDAALIRPRLGSMVLPRWLPIRKDPVQEGELVAALGYPDVPRTEPALGILSGTVLTKTKDYFGNNVVVVSARSSGGMSGGPVIDRDGRVIELP